jgi:hypothetical protein
MTVEDENRIRQIFREELRSALGLDQTDIEKLAVLPLATRKAYAKAQRLEEKRRVQR